MNNFFLSTVPFFIQALYEPLPTSSSGHVLLFTVISRHYNFFITQNKIIDDLAQGISVLCIGIFFFTRWYLFIKCGLLVIKKQISTTRIYPIVVLMMQVVIACIITILFYCMPCTTFMNNVGMLAGGFSITIICLMLLTWYEYRSSYSSVPSVQRPWVAAGVLAVVQGVGLWLPGVSRLATTYTVARFFGYVPRRAFELSWAIQFPLTAAAMVRGIVCSVAHPHEIDWRLLAYLFVPLVYVSYYLLGFCYQRACRFQWWWFALYLILPLSAAILRAFNT